MRVYVYKQILLFQRMDFDYRIKELYVESVSKPWGYDNFRSQKNFDKAKIIQYGAYLCKQAKNEEID